MKIEFLYFKSCPSHTKAYQLLVECLAEKGINPSTIVSIPIDHDEMALAHHFIGSPTIRINNIDIEKSDTTSYSLRCRLYSNNNKLSGVPPKELIVDAIDKALQERDYNE